MELSEYNQIVGKLRQQLAEERRFHESSIHRIAEMEAKLSMLINGFESSSLKTSRQAVTSSWAVANGHPVLAEEFGQIKEDDFDVILNIPANSLKYRKYPVEHTKLKESKFENIGVHRMQIFAYMLEHPCKPFYSENIYKAYTSIPEVKEPNTFTKTIGALRKALEQADTTGPYIIKQFDWNGITDRKRGYVYQINPDWRYLVIRGTTKISEQIPL